MSGLQLDHVTISLRQTGAACVRDLTLSVPSGTVTTIMGASGAGKSTLLAYIAGHLDPAFEASGTVINAARNITRLPSEARRIGILFQDDMLFPHLSVGANLAFGLPAQVKGRKARRARVEEALAMADLAGFADRDPATLSGGQRIRAALLRTLLSDPKALLLDEPFSKLDTGLRADMRAFVFQHARQTGLSVLLVTHDETDAEAACGPVITL